MPNTPISFKAAPIWAAIALAFLSVLICLLYQLAKPNQQPPIVDNEILSEDASLRAQSSEDSIEIHNLRQRIQNAQAKLSKLDLEKRNATNALNSSPEAIRDYVHLLNPQGAEPQTDEDIDKRIEELSNRLSAMKLPNFGCTFGDTRLPTPGYSSDSIKEIMDFIRESDLIREEIYRLQIAPSARMEPQEVLLLQIQTLDEKILDTQNSIMSNASRYTALVSKDGQND